VLGAERDHDGRALPALGSSNHHIDFTAATAGTDEPVAPIEHRRLGAISSGHFAGVGLDLMLALLAPDDEAHSRCRGIAEGH